MKISSVSTKFGLLAIFVLTVSVNVIFAQQVKPEVRYLNDKFKISFQLPEGVSKKTETPVEVIYSGDSAKFGDKATINFTGLDEEAAGAVSQAIITEEGFKVVVDSFINGMRREKPEVAFEILEQKRVKIAGLDSVKIVVSGADTDNPKVKYRAATYIVPSPEQKLLYLFMVGSLEQNFDKWLPLGEAAVNSFTFQK